MFEYKEHEKNYNSQRFFPCGIHRFYPPHMLTNSEKKTQRLTTRMPQEFVKKSCTNKAIYFIWIIFI